MGNTCSTGAEDQDLEVDEEHQEMAIRDAGNTGRRRPKTMQICPLGQQSAQERGSNGEMSSDEASMSEDTQLTNRTPREEKPRLPGEIFGTHASLATSSPMRPREMTFAPEASNDTVSSPYLKNGLQMREMTFNKTPILTVSSRKLLSRLQAVFRGHLQRRRNITLGQFTNE